MKGVVITIVPQLAKLGRIAGDDSMIKNVYLILIY